MGEEFATVLLIHAPHRRAVWGRALSRCTMITSSPDVCHAVHDEDSAVRTRNKPQTQPICIPQHTKQQFPWALFSASLSGTMFCDVIPCSVVWFPDQYDETGFPSPSTMLRRNSSPSTGYRSSSLEETFFRRSGVLRQPNKLTGYKLRGIPNISLSAESNGALFLPLLPFPCNASSLS